MAQSWFKFYRADWLGDPLLRSCSQATRGVLADLICLMEESQPRGYLLVNGIPPTDDEIANLCREPGRFSQRNTMDAIEELLRKGVLSRDDRGRIYSRRIVRKAQQSELHRANGALGGNPALNRQVKSSDKATDKPAPIPPKARWVGKRSGFVLFQWQLSEIDMRLGPDKRDRFDVWKFMDKMDAEIAEKGSAHPWHYILHRLVDEAALQKPNLFGRERERPSTTPTADETRRKFEREDAERKKGQKS